METVNQEQNATQEQATEKTFTQAELDAVLAERLQRERSKYADYASLKQKAEAYDQSVEANKTELQKATDRADALQAELNGIRREAEVRDIRDRIAKETGVPADLLTAETEEECKAQAEAIKAFAKPAYPNVYDGGEPTGQKKQSTAQQFADWFNSSF